MTILPLLFSILMTANPQIESRLEQVGPVPVNGELTRSIGQTRAVILVHGYYFHLRESHVPRAALRPWQKPGCTLVKTLQKEADVFSFGYGQNASLEDVVKFGGFGDEVARVKQLGYREIILLGHSAGGLIARQFVEDNPDCGVTRVVQVCTPNGGTPTAKAKVHASQQVFVDSLTEEARQKCLKDRAGKRIPDKVEFVCVLGYLEGMKETDGVVPCACQWSVDLQKQCIPVVPLSVSHHESTRTEKAAKALAKLVREKQPRWQTSQVEQCCKQLFKK